MIWGYMWYWYNSIVNYFYENPNKNKYVILEYNKEYNEVIEYFADDFETRLVLYDEKTVITKIGDKVQELYRIVYENMIVWYYRLMEDSTYRRYIPKDHEYAYLEDDEPMPPTTSWIVSYDENNVPHLSPDNIICPSFEGLLKSDNESECDSLSQSHHELTLSHHTNNKEYDNDNDNDDSDEYLENDNTSDSDKTSESDNDKESDMEYDTESEGDKFELTF